MSNHLLQYTWPNNFIASYCGQITRQNFGKASKSEQGRRWIPWNPRPPKVHKSQHQPLQHFWFLYMFVLSFFVAMQFPYMYSLPVHETVNISQSYPLRGQHNKTIWIYFLKIKDDPFPIMMIPFKIDRNYVFRWRNVLTIKHEHYSVHIGCVYLNIYNINNVILNIYSKLEFLALPDISNKTVHSHTRNRC